jgi:hypothetical protein
MWDWLRPAEKVPRRMFTWLSTAISPAEALRRVDSLLHCHWVSRTVVYKPPDVLSLTCICQSREYAGRFRFGFMLGGPGVKEQPGRPSSGYTSEVFRRIQRANSLDTRGCKRKRKIRSISKDLAGSTRACYSPNQSYD